MQNPALRDKFSLFLDTILQQISSKDFFSLTESIQKKYAPQTDKELYIHLLQHTPSLQPHFSFIYILKTLSLQKKILAQQVKQLIGPREIEGYMEIGSPGTYINSLKTFLSFTGPLYVLHDQKRARDIFQAFTLNPLKKFIPYTHFISLNNYDSLPEKDIPSHSLDLIVCFIGLHHVPHEGLDSFIASLYRILRPGGILILREHNAKDHTTHLIANAAHSVYNAIITKESVQSETDEIRNFHALEFWINLLQQQGFIADTQRLLQATDPTLNTLLKFTKEPLNEAEHIDHITRELKNLPHYKRDSIQTYLTTPEWINVDITQDYAEFINHTPFYKFPYISSIKSYWECFIQSWKTAHKKKGHFEILKSPYTMMNIFIGVTMTLEYISKSVISLPLKFFIADQEAETIKILIKDPDNKVETLSDKIKIIQIYSETLKLIEMPRYKIFLELIKKMAYQPITLLEIAGQKEIQVKIRYKNHTVFQRDKALIEYTWQLASQPHSTFAALSVPVTSLLDLIRSLIQDKIEILYIHDF
jgi:hypothetical protein